jgi:hypothetical protein
MPEEKQAGERPSPAGGPEPMSEGAGPRGLIEGVARAIGRTAGRTRDAIARLGGRGAIAIAMRRLEREKSTILEELGKIVRKSVSRPDGIVTGDDPRVAEIVRALDRIDEKLDLMRRRLSELAKGPSSAEDGTGGAGEEGTSGKDASPGAPPHEAAGEGPGGAG